MNCHSKVSISPYSVKIGELVSSPRTKLSGSNLVLTKWQTVQRQQDIKSGDLTEQGNLYRDEKENAQAEIPLGRIPKPCIEAA